MSNPLVVVAATLGLIIASAFFVIIEFALLGARRHRLEADAARSPSARAAIRGLDELTVMLAGAQLGVTACTFALGAVTKPAVDAWLGPALSSLGAPAGVADVVSFALSLLLVTFLHLVAGEMAPKSWAIAHPELAATIIGVPSRAFVWVFRPLLVWINTMANRLVSASGIEPVDRAAVGGQDADTIRQLVEHSASVGALTASMRTPLSGALELEHLTVEELVNSEKAPTAVETDATIAQVQEAAARTDHMRILLADGPGSAPEVVHVRDTLTEPEDAPARPLARRAMVLDRQTPVYEALALARERSEQLMAVTGADSGSGAGSGSGTGDGADDGAGRFLGVVTVADILRHILPEPDAAHS
ncbi:MAG TPA: DUF21 domain-containing protein [Candidatus Dietzia intestinipullorum]|nr:DUF21 domain-containing protein [Candidatus Dietzia intestinipullorum]